MGRKFGIAVVGIGNLGTALAASLHRAAYEIEAVIVRSNSRSRKKAEEIANEVGARVWNEVPADLRAEVIWIGVPDGEIAKTAKILVDKIEWKGRVALHSSGALTSDELDALRPRGAAVGSAHPLMTFVAGSSPVMEGVPFAIEGDAKAMRAVREILNDLGSHAYSIRKKDKAAYHAWGTFASPLFTALLATAEHVAAAAGVKRNEARQRMTPILLQTLANYAELGAAGAFSGPIVRGDVDTVRQHLRALRKAPAAREVYRALALAALQYLPSQQPKRLKRALAG